MKLFIVIECMRSQSRLLSSKFYRSLLTQYRVFDFPNFGRYSSREERVHWWILQVWSAKYFVADRRSCSEELVEGARFRDSVLALRKIGFQFFWLSNCAKKERRDIPGVRDPVDFVFEMPDRRNCVRDLRDRPSNGERRRRILSDVTRPDRFPGSHLRS